MKTEDMEKNEAKSLGHGLKTARELRNLSLREVEEATGISNAYLSQLENDKIKKPSPHFLHKLANLYGIGYELLMASAGYVQRKGLGGQRLMGSGIIQSRKS